MTPFKLIETYLHIPDSKGSSSLFEAEMFRSKEYIEKIKNMDPSHFSFIVLDEIFSSTNYIEGFSGAYSILKKISSFNNAMSITTTHYTDLEILEKDTNGKISNYKFEVEYKNDEILFNYLLKKGVSRQYIALDLLKKNGFDNDVIEDAITETGSAYKIGQTPKLDELISTKSNFILLVNRIDRFSRNLVICDNNLKIMKNNNIILKSVNDYIDLSSPIGRHTFRNNISQCQLESEIIGKRVKTSIKYRIENGLFK
jgi:DNA mismatch repair ATPase MutS